MNFDLFFFLRPEASVLLLIHNITSFPNRNRNSFFTKQKTTTIMFSKSLFKLSVGFALLQLASANDDVVSSSTSFSSLNALRHRELNNKKNNDDGSTTKGKPPKDEEEPVVCPAIYECECS